MESWNGGVFAKPATRVREMAQFLRAALAGERVVFKGQTISVDGFRLTKVPNPPVPIYIAALRPGMLKVAGEVGDGVIVNWNSPEDVPKSVAIVREAARKAGRDPEAIEVTARLFVNLDTPGPRVGPDHQAAHRRVPERARVPRVPGMARPHARAPADVGRAGRAGDRKGAVAAIPSAVVEELIARGPLPAIRARVQRYLDHGIDTAFLQFQTNDPDPARRRALVLDAMRGLAPSARS